jgi:Helix-turn-helix domain
MSTKTRAGKAIVGDDFPNILTIAEGAPIARRSEKALRQLIYRGRGPRVRRIGGRVFILESDLRAWILGDD